MRNHWFSLNKLSIAILIMFAFLSSYILHGYKNLNADLLSISQQSATSSISIESGNATSTIPVQSFNFTQDLHFGLTDSQEVQKLQQFLTSHNFYSGPITGNFFSLTLAAVKRFQVSHNLPDTGYFGILTRGAANDILASERIRLSAITNETGNQITPVLPPTNQTTTAQSVQPQQAQPLPEQTITTPPAATTPPEVSIINTFKYKMLIDPDQCTMNTLGADGWEISNISSGDLDLVKGFDGDCRKSGSFSAIPWVLFVKKQ